MVPSLSLATAVTVTVAGALDAALLGRARIDTLGGTFAAAVTCTAVDVVVAP
jgi:hypothetical protein